MSEALRDKRDRGRSGLTHNQFYIEYSDPDGPTPQNPNPGCVSRGCNHAKTAVGCALDDEARWASIMSALGTRVSLETIRSLRQAMPPEEFAREFLVWWEDPPPDTASKVFGPHWGRQGIPDARRPKPRCLAIAVEPDRSHSSLAAVGDYGDDAVRVVFPASSKAKMSGRRPGTTWVVDEACSIADRHQIPVAIAGAGPAADLVAPLRDRLGARLLVADMSELKDACAAFYDGVTESRTVFHNDSPELNDAARDVVLRMSGDRFLWGRDASMLEAATLALWGASQNADVDPWEVWT
jgi:hypothetical protein